MLIIQQRTKQTLVLAIGNVYSMHTGRLIYEPDGRGPVAEESISCLVLAGFLRLCCGTASVDAETKGGRVGQSAHLGSRLTFRT